MINVTGAGDSFVGVLAAGLYQNPAILRDAVLYTLVNDGQNALNSSTTGGTPHQVSTCLMYLDALSTHTT